MKVKIVVLACLLTLALGLSPAARASQSDNATFTYGVLWGAIEFPDEAHPLDYVTCNLTIGAYDNVNIYNFTLQICRLVGQDWDALGTKQLTTYIAKDDNRTEQIAFTLPQNTSGQLRCIIEASTDRGFGNTSFNATNVQAISYEELTKAYNELLSNHIALQANYSQLQTNNTALNDQSTYLKEKYDAATGELTIIRYLMYAFGLTTAILAATTFYFRKKAPYIVLRKESTSKPDSQ